MPYDWGTISKEWLLGQTDIYSQEQCVHAFTTVESLLGTSWIDTFTRGGRGLAITIPLIELGRTLTTIEYITGAKSIIERIRDLQSFKSAWSEADSIARFRRFGYSIKISPSLKTNGSVKYPDFGVRVDNGWVYVEVTRPEVSQDQRVLYQKMNAAQESIFNLTPHGVRVEVYLYRDPSDTEWQSIVNSVKSAVDEHRPQRRIEGLAQVFVSPDQTEKLPSFPDSLNERRPILVLVGMRSHGDSSTLVTLKIPFTDERAQRIFNREARQFSKKSRNLLIFDVSEIPSRKGWLGIISGRLQPKLNRRIGAVLVTQAAVARAGFERQYHLLVHPSPYNPVPPGLLEKLET